MQRYQNLKSKIRDLNLQNFLQVVFKNNKKKKRTLFKEYGLHECTWALDRIEKGLQNVYDFFF